MKSLSVIACTLLLSSVAQAEPHGLRMTIFPNSGAPTETVLAEFELDRDVAQGAVAQFSVDGQAVGAEQAMIDGTSAVSIPPMSHGRHTISVKYAATGGVETGSMDAQLLVNAPPILPRFGLGVTEGKAASFSVSALLKYIRDNDGDQVSLKHIDSTSLGGAKVTKLGDLITYTPSSGITGRDLIRYQAVDAYGTTASGVVEVQVRSADQKPKITIAAGKLLLTAPLGMSLAVQASTDMKDWTTLQSFDGTTRTAQVENWNCAEHPNHFYRTIPLPGDLAAAHSAVLTTALSPR